MTDALPKWFDGPVPEASWRAILKWGGLAESKHPNAGLVKLMQETFGMSDADFALRNLRLETAVVDVPCGLPVDALAAFQALLGPENVVTDGLARLRVAYGKTMLDLLRLCRASWNICRMWCCIRGTVTMSWASWPYAPDLAFPSRLSEVAPV